MGIMLSGKCMGGPYAGQQQAYHASTMLVTWIEGNPLNEITLQRAGVYEFKDGIWLWYGPPVHHQ